MPARRYPADSPMLHTVPFSMSGPYTANTANVIRHRLPFDARLVDASFAVRNSTGTTPTLTVDVLDDGVSLLTAPRAVMAAGGIQEASIVSNPVVAKDSVISVDLGIGGTTPSFADLSGLLVFERI